MNLLRTLSFLILVGVALTSCGSGSDTSDSNTGLFPRIINGTEVATTTSPQMVAIEIEYFDGTRSLCSGVFIGSRAILSAAHCFISPVRAALIHAGELMAPALGVSIAPGFFADPVTNAFFNDVAILSTAELGRPVLPILISQSLESGDTVLTFGFGLDENGSFGDLKAGDTEIEIVTENHFFAVPFSGEGTNACNGDSGGPAVRTVVTEDGTTKSGVIGLVSSGTAENCFDSDSTLYTNLQKAELIEFIAAVVPEAIFQ